MSPTRRTFLRHSALAAAAATLPRRLRAVPAGDLRAAIDAAHAELWRRFVDEHGIVLDETDLAGRYERPTPEECRLGKPNAVGWLTPIANGAMFTGLYLDAAIRRALDTRAETDLARVRRLVGGLELLASLGGGTRGFIARGPATDGRTTYPLGSNDQTAPWLLGMWWYVRSGLPDAAERRRLTVKIVEVGEELKRNAWRLVALPPFGFRNSFAEPGWDGAPRLLFLQRIMHALTGDDAWERLYREALYSRDEEKIARIDACARGVASRPKPRMWTGAVSVACLRELWELERDEAVRGRFREGLVASAEFAAGPLGEARKFNNDSGRTYDGDWRKVNHLWRPQRTSGEATAVSEPQRALRSKQSPRFNEESNGVREPAFAAWIVSLCPDAAVVARHRAAIQDAILHYRYVRLHLSQFFALENAWWRLPA